MAVGQDRSVRSPLQAIEPPRDALLDGHGIVELPLIQEVPGEPVAGDEKVGRGFERGAERCFRGIEWADLFIGRDRQSAKRCVVREPFADQSGQVRRDGFDAHRSKIDQPGDFISLKEKMFRAGVAKARLKGNGQPRRIAKFGQQPGRGRLCQGQPAKSRDTQLAGRGMMEGEFQRADNPAQSSSSSSTMHFARPGLRPTVACPASRRCSLASA